MEHLLAIKNDFQLLTVVTKSSILDVAGLLDPPLDSVFNTALGLFCLVCHWVESLNTLISKFSLPSNDSSRNIKLMLLSYPYRSESFFLPISQNMGLQRHRGRGYAIFLMQCDRWRFGGLKVFLILVNSFFWTAPIMVLLKSPRFSYLQSQIVVIIFI